MEIKVRVMDTKLGDLGGMSMLEGEDGKALSQYVEKVIRTAQQMRAKSVAILIVLDRQEE